MVHGLLITVNDPDSQNQIQIFCVPVFFSGHAQAIDKTAGSITTAQFNPGGTQRSGNLGQKGCRNLPVHQQGFHGVTDSGTLDLGIQADRFGHLQICGRIHISVADPFIMLDDRYFRILDDKADQAFTTPRNNQVDIINLLQQFGNRLAFAARHDLERGSRQIQVAQGLLQNVADGAVGMNSFRTTTQDHCISAFQAESGCIGSDIGARFVDDADNSQGDPLTADPHPVRPQPHAADLSNRVG